MPMVSIKMPDDFEKKLSKLNGRSDEVIGKSLTAGAKVIKKQMIVEAKRVIGKEVKNKNRSTGELASSIGVSDARVDQNGVMNVKIGFREPRKNKKSKKTTNAMLANVIEYGKTGQPPKPFIATAKKKSKRAAEAAAAEAFDSEVSKL